ncbi:MAG TPA: hypothetical protein VKA84_25475 [Gemmatimonadaceae bacterium]|nr:hypothetical protein [Gemmatimonadaceae bacterium]
MARDEESRAPGTNPGSNPSPGNRDKYRDNDDVRDPLEGDARTGGSADTRSEARGSARENVGNNARGTAADPTGPEGNDRTRRRTTEE